VRANKICKKEGKEGGKMEKKNEKNEKNEKMKKMKKCVEKCSKILVRRSATTFELALGRGTKK
jgi:galactokinase/mevalonate kinase-like predicted kinase